MVLATLGAWVQKWPYWAILGPIHGVMLALLGLVGDLTASLLKRDAGLKDFGDLIPEHGGIMDRVDSYVRIIVCSICLRFTTKDSCLLITYLCPLSSRFSRLLMDILSAHIFSHGLKLLPGPRPLPP
jgi:predicted CDP-diglyceride synthetase/phosphatidate cytidylyltransferase